VLAEPSSSRISFIPYVAEPEGLSARPYDHPNLNASVASDQSHEQPYFQPATPHGLPGLSSPDDFVSPLLNSVLLDVPGPPTTVDGSSSEDGQGDIGDESSPRRTAPKGKRKASNLLEEDRPLRRFKKKTEIACNFCRGKWPNEAHETSQCDCGCSWMLLWVSSSFALLTRNPFSQEGNSAAVVIGQNARHASSARESALTRPHHDGEALAKLREAAGSSQRVSSHFPAASSPFGCLFLLQYSRPL
jgi:hypothetical protein